VTWEAWDRCVELGGCSKVPTDQGYGRKGYPVINITWFEAKQYTDWLSRVTGKPYRLLTEAEWEYAARGVTSPKAPHPAYFWGDSPNDVCKHANIADQSMVKAGWTPQGGEGAECNDGFVNTSPVGKFPPNAFGLLDMAGNVFQWVEDCYDGGIYDTPPKDGSSAPLKDGCSRVVRGGSWFNSPDFSRAAFRGWLTPVFRFDYSGFRVARVLVPPSTLRRQSPCLHGGMERALKRSGLSMMTGPGAEMPWPHRRRSWVHRGRPASVVFRRLAMNDDSRRTGPAVEAHYQFLNWLMPTIARFPREQRFLLGDRIQSTALDVLEALIEATYTRERRAHLARANLGLEKLRFFIRLAHEQRHLDARRYEHAARQIDEVGRLVGGWSKASGVNAGASNGHAAAQA